MWFEENWHHILSSRTERSWWNYQLFEIYPNQKISLSEFLRKLDDLGYRKEQSVHNPGDFAARGGIVDVFALTMRTALRIEFQGNTIDTISPIFSIKNEELEKPLKKLIEKRASPLPQMPLVEGMFVVHEDHGIARFAGIEGLTLQGGSDPPFANHRNDTALKREGQYLILEYAAGDKILVPVEVARKVTPYIGFGTPTIHRLGGNLWEKTKQKARDDIIKTAQELAQIYAKRELATREPYSAERAMEEDFASQFPHEETRDQTVAIQEVFLDMEKEYPMDRLICGDVGFGKTEIALRAIARAVFSGRQTALIAPTTVLAWQHFRTLQERIAAFPIRVAMLSRITSKQEQKEILEGLASGAIDIVIGTHRLLSKDVRFKNLGLLVVDEEQRFGVRHKEHMKKMRAHIDILSLSATPIPRTLSFTLSGLRDVSIIQTSPPNRMPIKTIAAPWDKKIMQKAIEEELARNGQIYFLHNKVQTIYKVAQDVRELFPDARVEVSHAKLPDHQLIATMDEFRKGKIDILVATTIIENGLDISNVNTLIVDDVTRLGLAQAHQIRGRIGRGDVQAYAYLLYPEKSLDDAAKERVETLETLQFLGAGYQIALKDLEMRGAGNLLGRDQSGTLNKIGLNLYCQMLQDAIEKIRTEIQMP